jgi:hypothetical protein
MMARKSPPPSDKSRGRKAKDIESDLSRGRAALPPPAGLDVMPRPFLVDDIREDGKSVIEVEANEVERAALAEAYHLVSLTALKAQLTLAKRGPVIRITGVLKAQLTQTCVVTMEPFESDVEDQIEIEFAPPDYVTEAWERLAQLEASGSTEDLPEPPDQIMDGKIDLGAVTSEALALALDPYPKKPGAEFEGPADAAPTPEESPFAVLARLKGQDGQSTS